MATIQLRSSVCWVAFLGYKSVDIFSQLGGLTWLLSGRDLQSAGMPLLATIQSRSSVSWVAFIGYYPVEIFSQMGGLYWPLSGRDLQSIPLLVGLWSLRWGQSTLFLGQSDLQEVI